VLIGCGSEWVSTRKEEMMELIGDEVNDVCAAPCNSDGVEWYPRGRDRRASERVDKFEQDERGKNIRSECMLTKAL
jgi:hypothetical protein